MNIDSNRRILSWYWRIATWMLRKHVCEHSIAYGSCTQVSTQFPVWRQIWLTSFPWNHRLKHWFSSEIYPSRPLPHNPNLHPANITVMHGKFVTNLAYYLRSKIKNMQPLSLKRRENCTSFSDKTSCLTSTLFGGFSGDFLFILNTSSKVTSSPPEKNSTLITLHIRYQTLD